MAYLFVPFPLTLDDLESRSPNAGLIICNSTNISTAFCAVLTGTARRARSLGDRCQKARECRTVSTRSHCMWESAHAPVVHGVVDGHRRYRATDAELASDVKRLDTAGWTDRPLEIDVVPICLAAAETAGTAPTAAATGLPRHWAAEPS